jgi:hypothetical protein
MIVSSLMIEAILSSETAVLTRATSQMTTFFIVTAAEISDLINR